MVTLLPNKVIIGVKYLNLKKKITFYFPLKVFMCHFHGHDCHACHMCHLLITADCTNTSDTKRNFTAVITETRSATQ